MAAIVDPGGPQLAVLPSNPVPEGAEAGYVDTTDNVRLRHARWPRTAGAPRGTICLVHGRTEFIEKYFETIADLQQRGFSVATFDWRGQGGSARLTSNRALGYVESFEDYVTDLTSFHSRILLPDCPPPYYLVGHSMGGLVALMAAARDRMMFDRILLSAPMLALERQPLSMGGMASLAEAFCFLGLGQLPVGRRQERMPSERTFAGNPLTSDLRRYMRSVDVIVAHPELAIGSPSMRWSAAAMRAMSDAQADAFPLAIKVPVLMLAAARDEVVSTPAIETLGLRMRTGRHLMIPAARHELFMEADGIRGQVLAAVDAFLTEQSG